MKARKIVFVIGIATAVLGCATHEGETTSSRAPVGQATELTVAYRRA